MLDVRNDMVNKELINLIKYTFVEAHSNIVIGNMIDSQALMVVSSALNEEYLLQEVC